MALRSNLQSKFTVETIFLQIEPILCKSICQSHFHVQMRLYKINDAGPRLGLGWSAKAPCPQAPQIISTGIST